MITIEQLETEVLELGAKHAAKNAAHDATVEATENVTTVTNQQQSLIDQAVATFDVEVGLAKEAQTEAVNAETAAAEAEEGAFQTLLAHVREFKDQG